MLRRIEALNYRGLKHIAQDLAPFQILVGANASGKSTFLDVLGFVGDLVQLGLDDAILKRARNLDELIFKQSADSFSFALEFDLPFGVSNQKQPISYDLFRYEIEIGKGGEGEAKIWQERFLFGNVGGYATLPYSPLSPVLPLSVEDQDSLGLGADWLTLVDTRRIPLKSVLPAEIEQEWDFDSASVLNMALHSLPMHLNVGAIKHILTNDAMLVRPDVSKMKQPASPIKSQGFRPDGSKLPFLIKRLQTKHPQVYQDWLSHVQTILPDIEDIKVIEQEYDRNLFIAIQYRQMEKPVNAWLVSDGTLYILLLTIIAYLPDDQSIYMIEEPENGIHPLAIEGVYEVLSSAYDKQIFVATHSPLFLGLAKPKEILCFSKNADGAVEIVRGDNHPALQGWQGEIPLSTLYAGGVFG